MSETINQEQILAHSLSDPLTEGTECLSIILSFHKKTIDAAQLRHILGSPDGQIDIRDIVRLAIKNDVKSKLIKTNIDKINNYTFPIIAKAKDGGFFIIGTVQKGRVLVQRPRHPPQNISIDELNNKWTGEIILTTTRVGGFKASKFDVTWFIPALMKYRGLIGEVLLASLVLQIFGLFSPLFFQVIIDKVLVHNGITTLNVIAFGLIATIIFESVLGGLRSHLFTHTTSRVDVELGAKLYNHLISLPLAYFGQRRVGDSVARVRELETIRDFLTSSAVTLVIDLIFTFIFLVIMFVYSPLLFIIVLVSLLLYIIISFSLTPSLRKKIEEKFARNAENQSFLVESVTGIETIKASAVEPQMQRRWEDLLAAYVKSGFDAAKIGIWGGQAIQFVNKLSMALILFFGAKLVIEGKMTVGELVAFNMFAGRVSEPVLRISSLWQKFQEAKVGIDRLGDILNTPQEPGAGSSKTSLPEIRGNIVFEDVIFRYLPGGREILSNINLNIKAGEVIGIVGSSGSGKSTLAKLAQRLFVPERGRVLIDGIDLAMIDPSQLRRKIGVVLQENILFHRSVRDNIAFHDPAMPIERIIEVSKLAGCHDFILKLPDGYDTIIEERGSNLSGGQRQRLAIARALSINPRILIFDEATSALDAESEAIIQNNLALIAKGRTLLIIAHRLSAIKLANRIIAMDNGKIVEEGTHQELLQKNGLFAKLWKIQTQMRGM